MFKKLFSNNKVKYVDFPVSLMQVDMHNHLLFGIDDGSRTESDSLNMLKEYAGLGFKKVIASPHSMSDDYKNSPEIIKDVLAKVKAIADENNIEISLDASAEYYLDDGFEQKLEKDDFLPMSKDYLLFETSLSHEPNQLKPTIFEMSLKGLKPIFAHPERYFYLHGKTLDKYLSLKEQGTLFQLNLLSFAGQYGPEVKKVAEQLLEADMVDLIGTDAHHVKHLQALRSLQVPEKLVQKMQDKSLLNYSL